MVDLEPRRAALQGKLQELVSTYQRIQQHMQQVQADILQTQGRLAELNDLQAQVDGQKTAEVT